VIGLVRDPSQERRWGVPSGRVRSLGGATASVDEIVDWLVGVTYKDGWSFAPELGPVGAVLVVRAVEEDSRGGDPLVVTHRFPLPGRSVVGDREAFVGWLRHAIGRVELHERDEWLLVDRRRLFDPHAELDLREPSA
jgi:hypothetical protein